MNEAETRLWLRIRRPGGQDDADPPVAKALAQARHHPELAAERHQEEAADTAISRALHQQWQPPPDLLPRLLALGPAPVHRRPWFISLPARTVLWAACLALLAALAGWWLYPRKAPGQFAVFRSQMLQSLARAEGPLDLETGDPHQIRLWLAAHQAPDQLPVVGELGQAPLLGCRLLRWHGKPVALICFRFEGGCRAHLLVMAATAFSQPPPPQPVIDQQDGWTTASWSQDRWAYLLASRDLRPEELERLL